MWRLTSTEKYPKREVTVIDQSRFYEKSANPITIVISATRPGQKGSTKLENNQSKINGKNKSGP